MMFSSKLESSLSLFPDNFLCRTPSMNVPNFSTTYFEAREKFLQSAYRTDGEVTSSKLATKSTLGKELHIDFLNLVKGVPKKTLLYISGVHGAEAFSGSAIEVDLISSDFIQPNNTQVIFCHVLNPFGMVENHRTNENNVDLNRNFIIDGDYDVFSEYYPDGMFPKNLNELSSTVDYILKLEGAEALSFQQYVGALFSGQSHDSESLFYSGDSLSESYQIFIDYLNRHIPSSVKDVFTVDIHTGLGSFGDELLFSNPTNTLSNGIDLNLSLEKKDGVLITRPNLDDPTYYESSGDSVKGITNYFQKRSVVSNGICQEFGTYPFQVMISTLLIDNFYRCSDLKKPDFVNQIMQETFNPNSIEWQESILSKGRRLFSALLESYLA